MNNTTENNQAVEKIHRVATELYNANGQKSYPTVSQVRAAAKTDMNTTSEAMKQWRNQQEQQVQTAQIDIPDAVQKAVNETTAKIWSLAQHTANDALHTAQKAWEKDKAESEQLTKEIAEEYDKQSIILEKTTEEKNQLCIELQNLKSEYSEALTKLAGQQARLEAVEQHNKELLGLFKYSDKKTAH
ncbi:DNA-binding protein [Ectopseudomonas alcaliphila]|uniref:DNA-binding protein n=1 Tax=Ectopseudomonas alcaliphila TaxID=101564 RepID=A0A1G7LHT8_9GAMM|nr:DNA-binding protein [Pseudomonas alcaliphila]MDX5995099.1 DNA-binding protein [Pseudomonas alcaliphila]SDF49038.1 replication region DNA-binding N-term [Pseudomonas alcaliphila]